MPSDGPGPRADGTPAPSDSPTPSDSPSPSPSQHLPLADPVAVATTDYIVTFAAGTSSATQAAVLASAGVEVTSSVPVLGMAFIRVTDDTSGSDALNALRLDPPSPASTSTRSASPRARPPTPATPTSGRCRASAGTRSTATSAPSGSSVVALLDTGVDGSNPDLAGSLVAGTNILDGSDGAIDPNGHGTAMAGIIAAATDNATGIAGVGYAGVKVMPVTVLDADGVGQDSDIIAGIVYAVGHGATVISMSFSSTGYSAALQAAIDYAWAHNVVLVASVGNDGTTAPAYPAGDRGVIGVSNTDQNDALNPSSNSGAAVFLGAPGHRHRHPRGRWRHHPITGTSASAAEVAAAAALLRAIDPSASNGVIVNRLARNAPPVGTQDETGNGRLDLTNAVSDTTTDSVEPVGTGPGLGNGGPYVADATTDFYFAIANRHTSNCGRPPGVETCRRRELLGHTLTAQRLHVDHQHRDHHPRAATQSR